MAQISTVLETGTQQFLYAGTCVRSGQRNIKILWKVVTGHKMQTGGRSGEATGIAGGAGQLHEPLVPEMLVAVGEAVVLCMYSEGTVVQGKILTIN
jgi:hypothetical protein